MRFKRKVRCGKSVLTNFLGGDRELKSVKRLWLHVDVLWLVDVVGWEVSEGRVQSPWQVLVVGSLEWLVSGLGKNLLQVVLNDEAAGVVHLLHG